MVNVNLGKEYVKTEYGLTFYTFEKLDKKFHVSYLEDTNNFMYGMDNWSVGNFTSLTQAKKGLLNFIKKNSPQYLININKKYIA